MDDEYSQLEALERILIDASAEPVMLSFTLLRKITNDFSHEIGSGGFGVVYMGFLQNGKVAVKKLSRTNEFSEKQFEDELKCLLRVKHKNIVKFLGYCSDTQRKMERYNGEFVFVDVRQRLLCFEYVPNKSLHDYLKEKKSYGHEWNTCIQLIDGICQALCYLHKEERINHLDLKPENILVDADMVPKITDFGLSRRFGREQSRILTNNVIGSVGYIAPEYLEKGEISFKSDIYSLGIVIMKLLSGSNDFPDIKNWHKSLDIDCPQVKRCIEIAQICANEDQYKRPTIDWIIEKLNEKETFIQMAPPIFGKLSTPIDQEWQIGTFSGSWNGKSTNSLPELDKILIMPSTSRTANMSTMFGFGSKGSKISILAFEVANTIVKAYSLVKSLSKQRMRHLKEGLLTSESVFRLITEDDNQLLLLVEDDIREELRQFSKEVCRFGDRCIGPQWHNLARYLLRLESELPPRKNSNESALSNMQYLIKLAQRTSELYQELLTLERIKLVYMTLHDQCMDERGKPRVLASNVTISSLKKQRVAVKIQSGAVKNLKKKSLWSKNLEDIVEKLIDIVHFMHLEINSAFVRNHGKQSAKAASNLGQTLGPTGLALHYADAILQIKTLALASPVVPDKARDALYQALPPHIKSVLHTQLRRGWPQEKTMTTVAEVTAKIDRVLQWLVPAAESTRLYYLNGAFGEWAMKGVDDFDAGEASRFKQEGSRSSASAMLRHEDAKVTKIETLYYANKGRTEGYILYLVQALQHLVFAYEI